MDQGLERIHRRRIIEVAFKRMIKDGDLEWRHSDTIGRWIAHSKKP